MEPIYNEFKEDLDRIKNLVSLLDNIKHFARNDVESPIGDDAFSQASYSLHESARQSNTGITILPGTLLLYLGGRFENYVRTVFEELCVLFAARSQTYDNLPKQMKENLIKFTAEVISNPRKYGHAENGVSSFIKNLNTNIATQNIETINIQCLSITYENMRPDTINDLFSRIGATNIWDRIAEQSRLKLLLNAPEHQKTQAAAKKVLTEFVDLRNKIAHPSSEFTWPDKEKVLFFIDFLDALSLALKEVAPIFVLRINTPQNTEEQQIS
jgi:hypothetical protein